MPPATQTPVAMDLNSLGDRALLAAIGISAAASVFLGLQFIDSGMALVATAALLVIAAPGYTLTRGTPVCRYVLAFVLVSLVALHIQLARGVLELHFGVFVVLAFLLAYLDWRVIVFGAALVEQSAAAAESLRLQARQLVPAVAVFKPGDGDGHPVRVEPPLARPAASLPGRSFPAVERRAIDRVAAHRRIA